MAFRVLIVEDSEAERRALRRFFESCPQFDGFSIDVIEAADGEEGLACFVEHAPDLLVVDLLLPRVDGLTLCRQVRARPEGSERPIIAVSGVYKEPRVVSQLAAEQIELLAKPVDLAVLTRKVLATIKPLSRGDGLAEPRWTKDAAGVAGPTGRTRGAPSGTGGGDARDLAEPPATSADQAGAGAATAPHGPALVTGEQPAAPLPDFDFSAPFKGQLDRLNLGTLLILAREARATGTLKIQRGRVKKAVFIVEGRPIYVDSNLRNETLGAYLVAKGELQENDLNAAMKQARSGGTKLGTALVALGFVDERTLQAGLRAQTRIKTVSALRWSDGLFSFTPGDEFRASVPAFPVDVVQLVLLAGARFASGIDLGSIFAAKLGHRVCLTERGREHAPAVIEAFGSELFGQGLVLGDLQQKVTDGAAALSKVYAMLEVQLAELVAPEHDAGSTEAGAAVTSGSVAEALQEFGAPSAPSVPLALSQLEPVAFSGEVRVPGPELDPTTAGWDDQDSGVVEIPRSTDSVLAEVATSDLNRAEEEARLREFFRQAQQRAAAEASEVPESQPGSAGAAVDPGAAPGPFGGTVAQSGGALAFVDPLQRHDYDGRLAKAEAQEPVSADSFGAELYFQEGQTLLRSGDTAGAIAAFDRAVEINPTQPDYHAQLAWAHFLRAGRGEGGARAARPHLRRALEIAPDSVRAHEMAGRIERDAGALLVAADHFSTALRFGQARADLFVALKETLGTLGDYPRLENHYRTMIMRLRESDPEKTLPYWLELAYLYRDQLERPEDAALALKVAARLAPDDNRVRAAFASIANVAAPWQDIAEGHRQRLAAHPEDPAPLFELFALHREAGREADQLVVAAILETMGQAGAEHLALLARLRASDPPLVSAEPLSDRLLSAMRHPADELGTEAVLDTLTEVLEAYFPVPPEQLGIANPRELAVSQLPELIAEAFRQAASLLRLAMPGFVLSRAALPMAPIPGRADLIVISELLLSQQDRRLLLFLATRALACSRRGRREVFLRRGGDLRAALLAALKASRPGFRVADPDGRIAALSEHLAREPETLLALSPLLDRLFSSERQFNLSEWMRGVRRSSARLALLTCGDVTTALRALDSEPATLRDLVDFSLSATYRWAASDYLGRSRFGAS